MDLNSVLKMKIPQFIAIAETYADIKEKERIELEKERRRLEFINRMRGLRWIKWQRPRK